MSAQPVAAVRCEDHLDLSLAPASTRDGDRARGFGRIAATFFVLQVGGTLPVPLYVLWEQRIGFGTGTLTLIFAVYALGTLTSLLLLAPLSDQVGRRPALLTAIGLAGASTALFLAADSVAILFVARFLSGMAVAMNTAAGTAALRELAPSSRAQRASVAATALNMSGLGFGPLLAGVLAQYGHDPTQLVFWVYLALLVPATVAVMTTTETVDRPERVALRPRGLAIPSRARADFAIAAVVIFCAFTMLGLFSSLVPSFLASSLHEHNHAIAGSISAAIFAVAAAVQVALRRITPEAALGAGLPILILGLGLIEAGLLRESLDIFLAGTAAGGIGVGLSFMGSTAVVNQIAPPARRAEVIAAYFASGYCGMTIPVVAVGVASQSIGTDNATLGCAIATAALAGVALLAVRRRRRAGSRVLA
jgi:MFS family permease